MKRFKGISGEQRSRSLFLNAHTPRAPASISLYPETKGIIQQPRYIINIIFPAIWYRSITCVLRLRHTIIMVGVRDKTCARPGCPSYPSYGVKGCNKREFCSQHAEPGMVNVCHRKCIHEGCLKRPSFGIKGFKRKDYCEAHSEPGMVNLNVRCSRHGCSKIAGYSADKKMCYHQVRNMASRRGKQVVCARP